MEKNLLSLHLLCAFISLLLLIIRGRMQYKGKNWRKNLLLRKMPLFSDCGLLVTGVALIFLTKVGFSWWILVKLGLVVEYILFSRKYFEQNTSDAKSNNRYLLALLCLSSAVLLSYYH